MNKYERGVRYACQQPDAWLNLSTLACRFFGVVYILMIFQLCRLFSPLLTCNFARSHAYMRPPARLHRLYLDKQDETKRRSAQTVMHYTVQAISTYIAPIACHLAEELHGFNKGVDPAKTLNESVMKQGWFQPSPEWNKPELVRGRHVFENPIACRIERMRMRARAC